MSDTPTKTAETPVNDGGGTSGTSGTSGTTAPQTETEPTDESVAAETPVNQGGGGD